MHQIPYEYKNMPIPGGGYVTGFLYSETEKDVLYIRTDIGGTYRYDAETQTWISLISHVTMEDLSETFPISIAIDEKKPGSLYIACGVNKGGRKGVLAISEDYGETFRYEKMPMFVHGNLNGRGTAERLYAEGDELWYASQTQGLWHSTDLGATWKYVPGVPEGHLTFVTKIRDKMIVGSAGVTTGCRAINWPRPEETKGFEPNDLFMRGHSLYISRDGGENFCLLDEPESFVIPGCRANGQVAQRWAVDEKFLYVTFASTGRSNYVTENGYSCDSGDNIDGYVVRYNLDFLGMENIKYEDITPVSGTEAAGVGLEHIHKGSTLEFGFSGISVSRQTPGMLVATTIVKWDGDSVFRSMDYGETWQQVLYDLQEGEITFRAPYMRPECNGGHSLIHWLSDFKINPFNDNDGWFNSGTGVFRTQNLKDETVRFVDWCDGIEETVHLNVYGMPAGEVRALAILGDLGGFAFKALDEPCANSFADAAGNRYITCINADYSDEHPETILVTPRGNWTGKTFGGLILSRDGAGSWDRLPQPFGLTEDLDEALHNIERPNVNSGWAAMSPDCKNIVWTVASMIDLPVNRLVVSHDGGQTFTLGKVYDTEGRQVTAGKIKVFSDRKDSTLFYGFGEASQIYVSRDCGETYRQYETPAEFPVIEFGLIDCANKTEVRGESGRTGVFYLAIGQEGIWKLIYDKEADSLTLKRLTRPGISALRMGLGLGRKDGDYLADNKAIYFNGTIDGTYGFYRSCDDCESFTRINTDRQMYGEINSIDGDCREFGVFYLATGSNGVKYGREV